MKITKTHSSTNNNDEVTRGKGHLFIVSAPSGAGKTTLCQAVLDRFQDILYSVSHTTRKPRIKEKMGVDYHFITKEEFIKGIENGKWAEWAQVHGNFYGTSAEFINKGLSTGRDILIDIDVQGTMQILKNYADAVTFFVMPPSLEILKKRLESRGTEDADAIAKRIQTGKEEMAQKSVYRHVIVNDSLSEAISELVSIIENYRSGRNTSNLM